MRRPWWGGNRNSLVITVFKWIIDQKDCGTVTTTQIQKTRDDIKLFCNISCMLRYVFIKSFGTSATGPNVQKLLSSWVNMGEPSVAECVCVCVCVFVCVRLCVCYLDFTLLESSWRHLDVVRALGLLCLTQQG